MYPSCGFGGFFVSNFIMIFIMFFCLFFFLGVDEVQRYFPFVGATPFLQQNPEENLSLSNMCTYERATHKNAQRYPLIRRHNPFNQSSSFPIITLRENLCINLGSRLLFTHSLSQSCCQNGANLLKNYVSLKTLKHWHRLGWPSRTLGTSAIHLGQ